MRRSSLAPTWLVCCAAGLLMLSAAGCNNQPPAKTAPVITQEEGYLPRLRLTENEQLAADLAAISKAKGLPEQLHTPPIPRERNAAPELLALLPPAERQPLWDQTEGFFPTDEFSFSVTGWEQARHFLEEHSALRQGGRTALNGRECDFPLDYTRGLSADLSFVLLLRSLARLEAIHAEERMKAEDLEAAQTAIAQMFRLARCLDGEQHVTCRLQAGQLRKDAFLVLERFAQRENVTREDLLVIRELLDPLLAAWPEEREAWVADRALGLITYEYAREHALSAILTEAEKQSMSAAAREALDLLPDDRIDSDAEAYLQAMSDIIEQSDQPLFRRQPIVLSVAAEMPQPKGAFPLPDEVRKFSLAKLLIESVPNGQAQFAWDRARVEAWRIAVAAALGESAPKFELSPLSGEPYKVIDRDDTIAVWGMGAVDATYERPIVIHKPR